MQSIPHEIFREYDIRGHYPDKLNEVNAHLIGKALGSEILAARQRVCFVAWDGRHSSPSLRDALVSGICSTGCDVKLIAECPTAVAFWTIKETGQSCAMITGSHNPKQDNGIKIAVAGSARSGEDIQVLLSRIQLNLFSSGKGRIDDASHLFDDYQQRLTEFLTLKRPLKVVLDAGNGIGGPTAVNALKRLGCEVIEIACDVDGDFPLHHPDPAKSKNLKWLQKAVLENNADVGLGLDGDADRLGVIDNLGNFILPDRLSLLFIDDIIKRQRASSTKATSKLTFLYDVKCSSLLQQHIDGLGLNGKMIATGHTSMKRAIKETNAAFATELSGHILFNDENAMGVDDGIYAGLRLCQLLSEHKKSLSQLLDGFPHTVSTEEIQIAVNEEDKFSLMALIQSHCFKDYEPLKIDGLRINFADGWALVRASNTTPCLTLRFEALDASALNRIQMTVRTELLPYLPDLPDFSSLS